MERGIITMSVKEAKRLHLVRKAIEKRITQADAADMAGLSLRQLQRVVHRIRTDGDAGVCHRARGRTPNNQIPETVKSKVVELCRTRYHEFGPTLVSEKLLEKNRIKISVETLRTWFLEVDLPYRKRKKRPHRQWRERKACRGAMVQLDGSHHDWFEGRGPVCVLMACVDDASGEVYARFYDYEGTLPAMDLFKRYIKQYGIPQSVYLDRHSTYKATVPYQTIEDELEDRQRMSHFERSLAELGVTVIHAYSPQAKGRVERGHGTHQDRLIKKMRLKGIRTYQAANQFLKEHYLAQHNGKYAVAAREPADYHLHLPPRLNLEQVFCLEEERIVSPDWVVQYGRRWLQIEREGQKVRVERGTRVTVREHRDESLSIWWKGVPLRWHEITERPRRAATPAPKRHVVRRPPGVDHPWRKPVLPPRAVSIAQVGQAGA